MKEKLSVIIALVLILGITYVFWQFHGAASPDAEPSAAPSMALAPEVTSVPTPTPTEAVPEEPSPSLSLYRQYEWSYGSILTKNGKSQGNQWTCVQNRCRTRFFPVNPTYVVDVPAGACLIAYFYQADREDAYLGAEVCSVEAPLVVSSCLERYPAAQYLRLVAYSMDDANIPSIQTFLEDFTLQGTDMFVHDAPDSQGVANVVKRARQMIELSYQLTADLPAQETSTYENGRIPADTTITGVKYTSTRVEQLFVPQAVSFETYLSAASDPNSYLYTRNLSGVPNAMTYYGAVCSSFVAYCYGIDDVIPTTISFSSYDGFVRLPDEQQNVQSLRVGYLLNRAGAHIVLVTDILRDSSGEIQYVELSEAVNPFVHRILRKPAEIAERYYAKGYELYRYDDIDSVTYKSDAYAGANGDDTSAAAFNANIMPRRGNKANWRANEPVEIDILRFDTYTRYALRDGEGKQLLQRAFSESERESRMISLDLEPGRYQLCLTDGRRNSDPVYFDVISTSEYYSVEGNAVTVKFDSNLGTPTAVIFANNNPDNADYLSVRMFRMLTPEQVRAGQATVEKPTLEELRITDESRDAPNGVWLMRVVYRTDYGLYSSDMQEVAF